MPISNDTVQPGGDGIRQLYFCCSKNIVMALLWPHKCYLNSLPAFYPELLLVATSKVRPPHAARDSDQDTSCGARVRCPVAGHVSGVQCPGHVSGVQCPGHVSTHFHWPGSGAGPPITASNHGGHLAGHLGIIITCCSSNSDKYTTYNKHLNVKLFFHSISKARQ